MHARATTLCVTTTLLALLASCAMATSALAASSGFTLPDERQWEQVSPQQKDGSSIKSISFAGGEIQAAEDGQAITYLTSGPFEEAPAANTGPDHQQILSQRQTNGTWSTQDIAAPHKEVGVVSEGKGYEYKAFGPNLETALLEPSGETLLPPPSTRTPQEQTLYLRDDKTSVFQPLASEANTPPGTLFGETFSTSRLKFLGSSPSLEHAVFNASNELTKPNPAPGPHDLYEWSGKPGEPGQIELVSITPQAENLSGGDTAYLGYGDEPLIEVVRNAVSDDGSRVAFEVFSNSVQRLYLRDMRKGETVRIDTPEEGEEASSTPIFQGANSDGTRVFFIDKFPLVAEADEGHRPGEGDLYVYEAKTGPGPLSGQLHDLTEGGETHGFVIGYGGEGEGGLTEPYNVYFVDSGELSSNEGPDGGKAESGGKNLYVDHYNGKKWETPTFIAKLSEEDFPSWGASSGGGESSLARMTSRVSSSGRFLAFMSEEPLTGYDNVDLRSGVKDEEVFLYDAKEKTLVCASCDPSGERPQGVYDLGRDREPSLLGDELNTWKEHWLAGSVPGWTAGIGQDYSEYQSRYLLNSGRLFFESPADLVAGAVNGREDVYEYEPAGVGRPGEGQCGPGVDGPGVAYKSEGGRQLEDGATPPVVSGCVGLISSGTSSEESAFLDASGIGPGGEEGEDVFFLTAAQLSPQDEDSSYDIYDAHECSTQVPCSPGPASVPPACNNTDSCRAAPAPQPAIFGAPSSATFNGAGNPAPTITPAAKSNTKPQTRGQKLTAALKACKRQRSKQGRTTCETRAKLRYAPAQRK